MHKDVAWQLAFLEPSRIANGEESLVPARRPAVRRADRRLAVRPMMTAERSDLLAVAE
jgi:hypothetical protein